MHNLPAFLAKSPAAVAPDSVGDLAAPYQPLLAIWLLEMALALGWYRKPTGARLPGIFAIDYFTRCTGALVALKDDDADELWLDDKQSRRITDASLARLLQRRLPEIRRQPLGPDLPLFRNIHLLGELLALSDAEKAVLTFFVALDAFPDFHATVSSQETRLNKTGVVRLLSILLGRKDAEIAAALHEEATLAAARILWFDWQHQSIENQANLISGLGGAMLAPNATAADLADRFLRRTGEPTLECADFPHLARDIATVTDYLAGVLRERASGANVLLYGPPGTGKTQVAKAIAAALGVELYEVGFADSDGDPIKGTRRLAEFNLCQRLLAQQKDALLMFDEIEDVFESRAFPFMLFAAPDDAGSGRGKAWINRTLERNPTPAIWITNDPDIDPAYLRRFDYSVRFPVPPQPVRLAIARRYLGELDPPPEWLERIAANEHTTPAQLAAAARVAKLVAQSGDLARARAVVDQALDRSATLLDQKRTPPRPPSLTRFDLAFVNADVDVARLIERLAARPSATLCFYGPPGTGKSELARHLADALGKPLLARRASDILSMWVGGAERNIADMFTDARAQDAVLVLDEADSFLADRRGAQRQWEVTQVNACSAFETSRCGPQRERSTNFAASSKLAGVDSPPLPSSMGYRSRAGAVTVINAGRVWGIGKGRTKHIGHRGAARC